ncbi:MAG: hypothetical protein HXX09_00525 [Bacteroidetes bacterium]|nr:hypothetical protein [Bacteroidota bacterium]
MKKVFNKFLINLSVFSVAFAIIIAAMNFILPEKYYTQTLPYQLVFFFASTLLVHKVLLNASEKRFTKFVTYFMASTFFKLVLYIVVMVVYVFVNKPDAIPFIISFFILYLSFTIFEVMAILSYKKPEDLIEK